MSLIKKYRIVSRNSLIIAGLLVATLFGLNWHGQKALAEDINTNIGVLVCQEAQRVPAFTNIDPANNAVLTNNNTDLAVTTDWGINLKATLNGTQVFDQNVAYQTGVTTNIPLNNLTPLPGHNTIVLTLLGGCPEITITRTINLDYDAGGDFGYIIAPNTGFLKIGSTTIPNWAIYLIIIACIATLILIRRKSKRAR